MKYLTSESHWFNIAHTFPKLGTTTSTTRDIKGIAMKSVVKAPVGEHTVNGAVFKNKSELMSIIVKTKQQGLDVTTCRYLSAFAFLI